MLFSSATAHAFVSTFAENIMQSPKDKEKRPIFAEAEFRPHAEGSEEKEYSEDEE